MSTTYGRAPALSIDRRSRAVDRRLCQPAPIRTESPVRDDRIAAALLRGLLLVWHASTIVLFQALAPISLRGRALASFVVVFVVVTPVGSVGGGPIADAAGVATTLAGSGIPLVGGSVLVEVLSPALRLGVPDGPGLP